ncbi:MAG: hypothetical protein RMK29_00110 [Myxococcales bacterium]|nr:hypothetical protein [Myxococcota bacterium]MDW8280078.1 hypothetical protein [Myxococcales bacterium]
MDVVRLHVAPWALLLCASCLDFSPDPPLPEAPRPPSPPQPQTGRGVRTFPPIVELTLPGRPPPRLSQTGLYSDIARKTLAPGVELFRPRYELWSDGAAKTRWVLLPPGAKIDTQRMDRWHFPVGIKLWKEFTKDGKRLETRMLWKRAEPSFHDPGWEMQTYVWDETESEAFLDQDGVVDARGTDHEVPRQIDCNRCHRVEFEAPLGFDAVQLSGDGPGLRLRDLVLRGVLTVPPPSADGYTIPGDATARAALGYLHANCGSCHAPDSDVFRDIDMSLRLEVGKLTTVTETPTYLTTVERRTTSIKAGAAGRIRIRRGNPLESEVYQRMGIRMVGPESLMMPPLASHTVDEEGRRQVADWIRTLP